MFVCGSRLLEDSVTMKSHSAPVNIVFMSFPCMCLVCCSVPHGPSILKYQSGFHQKKEKCKLCFYTRVGCGVLAQ